MFLSTADLERLKKIYNEAPCSDIENKITYGEINREKYNEIVEILSSYVDLSQQYLLHTFKINSNKPCQIHGDYNVFREDINGSIVIIIPFQTVMSYTVVFNQECFDEFSKFKASNQPLTENNIVKDKENLSHISDEDLSYVSIKSKEKWDDGRILMFDRKLLHCSDDFRTAGHTKKVAAVLWFCYR